MVRIREGRRTRDSEKVITSFRFIDCVFFFFLGGGLVNRFGIGKQGFNLRFCFCDGFVEKSRWVGVPRFLSY